VKESMPAGELNVVLVEPQIPPNTGNIARLCAALKLPLYLVGELGFQLSDRYLKRAGLDYWPHVDIRRCPDTESFFQDLPAERLHLFTKTAVRPYTSALYATGDFLVFGSETQGLPRELLGRYPGRDCAIPMRSTEVRSLNLSSAVAVAVYEAARQIQLFRAV